MHDRLCVDPTELRFGVSLNISPFCDSPGGGHTSIERLYMENGELRNIGLDVPDPPQHPVNVPKHALTACARKLWAGSPG